MSEARLAERGRIDAELQGRPAADVGQELVAVEDPLVDRELHAETVEQAGETPCRRHGVLAHELTRLDAAHDDGVQAGPPGTVQILADAAHHRAPQRLAPAIDPEHPRRLAGFGHVERQHRVQLGQGRRRLLQQELEAGDVPLRGVAQGLREEELLRLEVVVDEAGRDAEPAGDVRDARGGEAPLDDDLAGGLEDLRPPSFDRRPRHRCPTLHTHGGVNLGRRRFT